MDSATLLEYRESDLQINQWGSTAVATYKFHIRWRSGESAHSDSGHDILTLTRDASAWLIVWRLLVSGPSQ
jgi:hypothetical protein